MKKFEDKCAAMEHALQFIISRADEVATLFALLEGAGLVHADSQNCFVAGFWATEVLGLEKDPVQQLDMGMQMRAMLTSRFGKTVKGVPLQAIMSVAADLVLQWPQLRKTRAALDCPGKKIAALN